MIPLSLSVVSRIASSRAYQAHLRVHPVSRIPFPCIGSLSHARIRDRLYLHKISRGMIFNESIYTVGISQALHAELHNVLWKTNWMGVRNYLLNRLIHLTNGQLKVYGLPQLTWIEFKHCGREHQVLFSAHYDVLMN